MTDRVKYEEVLHRVKEERNILHNISNDPFSWTEQLDMISKSRNARKCKRVHFIHRIPPTCFASCYIHHVCVLCLLKKQYHKDQQ